MGEANVKPFYERRPVFGRLDDIVGRTPLLGLKVGSGCIQIKTEFWNPTGSHYDRIMLKLLADREQAGFIRPGKDRLLDVTSGNSGASLAWIGRVLGYEVHVIMAADLPDARRRQIASFGASILSSPAGRYVEGSIEKLREVLRDESMGRFHLVNHAADEVSVPAAMVELCTEIVGDVRSNEFTVPSTVVLALGNGSTLELASLLKSAFGSKVIAFEPVANPRWYVDRYGIEHFLESYGHEPRWDSGHGLLGTGAGVSAFGWPLVTRNLSAIDEIRLVERSQWEQGSKRLMDDHGLDCGRTSGAAFAIASDVIKNSPRETVLMFAYDSAWKYF